MVTPYCCVLEHKVFKDLLSFSPPAKLRDADTPILSQVARVCLTLLHLQGGFLERSQWNAPRELSVPDAPLAKVGLYQMAGYFSGKRMTGYDWLKRRGEVPAELEDPEFDPEDSRDAPSSGADAQGTSRLAATITRSDTPRKLSTAQPNLERSPGAPHNTAAGSVPTSSASCQALKREGERPHERARIRVARR